MPTYEFKCCGNTETVINTLTGVQNNPPECGSCLNLMQRVYSFGAIKFKGSGFYSNDRKEDTK